MGARLQLLDLGELVVSSDVGGVFEAGLAGGLVGEAEAVGEGVDGEADVVEVGVLEEDGLGEVDAELVDVVGDVEDGVGGVVLGARVDLVAVLLLVGRLAVLADLGDVLVGRHQLPERAVDSNVAFFQCSRK